VLAVFDHRAARVRRARNIPGSRHTNQATIGSSTSAIAMMRAVMCPRLSRRAATSGAAPGDRVARSCS